MRLYSGTSGWNYDEWAGAFYPDELKKDERLRYYAARLNTVEVNNTFYRIPRTPVVEKWVAQVPDGFSFVLKASRRITHFTRLKEEAHETMQFMWRAATALGAHRGPLLFQLPPNLKKDLPRLVAFLERMPEACKAVFEFRQQTWFDDEVFATLRAAGAALCCADTSAEAEPPIVATTDWGYFRLRRETYSQAELDTWADRIQEQPWNEVYVFFKHEDEGAAPRLAIEFARRFDARASE